MFVKSLSLAFDIVTDTLLTFYYRRHVTFPLYLVHLGASVRDVRHAFFPRMRHHCLNGFGNKFIFVMTSLLISHAKNLSNIILLPESQQTAGFPTGLFLF